MRLGSHKQKKRQVRKMKVKICNTASNAETSAVLQALKQLSDGNGIPCDTETKDVPGTKGNEIIAAVFFSLAANLSSAVIYDLLKAAFQRRFGNGASKEAKGVKISVEIDGKKEDWEPKP